MPAKNLAATAIGVAVLLSMRPASPEGSDWHETIARGGIVLTLVGVIGRTWCTMYIGGNKLNRLPPTRPGCRVSPRNADGRTPKPF